MFDGAGRFEFERYFPGGEARNCYTVMVFDRAGHPADILAWRPDERALWLGAVDFLGEEQLEAPRIENEALDVWPDVVPWLAAERRGVVILSPRRAFEALRRASPLRVQSASQARALRQILQRELPRIVVRDHPVQQRHGCAA